jgi:hypothetical protein
MLVLPAILKPLGVSHIEAWPMLPQLLDGPELVEACIPVEELLEELDILYAMHVSACGRRF